MTFFVSPLMALGLNLIPMTVANIWQFSKADNPRELIKNYKYFAISLGGIYLNYFFLCKSNWRQCSSSHFCDCSSFICLSTNFWF